MKLITTIICGIFFLSMISAINLTAGECSTIEFPNEDNVNIEIIGNSFDMEGFNWSKNGTTIEYCFSLDYKPDNFTIRWFNEEEVYVEEPHQGGGGSRWSSKKEIIVNETQEEPKDEIDEWAEWTESDEEPIVESKKSLPVYVKVLLTLVVFVSFQLLLKRIKVRKAARRLKENE